jgi:nucleosome binding factor SPN SPT16 subunit
MKNKIANFGGRYPRVNRVFVFDKFFQVDIAADMGQVLAIKEDVEISTMKRSAQITVDVFTKFLRQNIMTIVDSDKVCALFTCFPPNF